MKKIFLFICLGSDFFELSAQYVKEKPIIDTSVFEKWESVRGAAISDDGRYASFHISNKPLGSQTLVISSTEGAWKEELPGCNGGDIAANNSEVLYKTPGDSLCIQLLGTEKRRYISGITFYQLPEQSDWVAYRQRGKEKELQLLQLSTDKELHFSKVEDYVLSNTGKVLLIQQVLSIGDSLYHSLTWVNLVSGKMQEIWEGRRSFQHIFDQQEDEVAFLGEDYREGRNTNSIWYYKEGMPLAKSLVNDRSPGIDTSFVVGADRLIFSPLGDRVFFQLSDKMLPKPNAEAVKVDVYHYLDKPIQSVQLFYDRGIRSFAAVYNIDTRRIVQLEREDERLIRDVANSRGDYVVLCENISTGSEFWHTRSELPTICLLSTRDGSKVKLEDSLTTSPSIFFNFPSSPNGRFYLYFDRLLQVYKSFEAATDKRRDLTGLLKVSFLNSLASDQGLASSKVPVGIGGWLADESGILIYDDYDIWLIDPLCKRMPVNLTRGFGRSHHLKFRLLREPDALKGISLNGNLLLSAFDGDTKYNGFYQVSLDAHSFPEKLRMSPSQWDIVPSQVGSYSQERSSFTPLKAKQAERWIVQRMSATDAPNYYVTENFISFRALSAVQPQLSYNWLTAELLNWLLPDGRSCQGILYKPENFDPHKKYPVLFTFYEKKSDGLYQYLEPEEMGAVINIPYFVSRGYLVCAPDIQYKIGEPGESALAAIVSAAKLLDHFAWVDTKRMGLCGHSFGGYETNYVVTHSHIFAAAVAASGLADFVSGYGGLMGGETSGQYLYEIEQARIGATLWERPDLYIKNSPIFKADQVTTPLLLMSNKMDAAVRWTQGLEMFTALRRLNKKTWLLQYDKGGHGLPGDKEAFDFGLRMTQFFDHYLKDALAPRWMTTGVPARRKGIDMGYELDTSGQKPL